MNNISLLIGIIPSLFILFVIGKTIYDALKNECFYFVSYYWQSEKQTGYGNIEIPMHGSCIDSFDDIQEVTTYIQDHTKDTFGNTTTIIVLSYQRLPYGSKTIKKEPIIFTDNGVKFHNLRKR